MMRTARDWFLSVRNKAIKHTPFLATERSIIGHKVQSYFPLHG